MHTNIEIKLDMEKRIKRLLSGNESINNFCYKAVDERVNRMEARSERAKAQMMGKNRKLIEPIILDILKAHGVI